MGEPWQSKRMRQKIIAKLDEIEKALPPGAVKVSVLYRLMEQVTHDMTPAQRSEYFRDMLEFTLRRIPTEEERHKLLYDLLKEPLN